MLIICAGYIYLRRKVNKHLFESVKFSQAEILPIIFIFYLTLKLLRDYIDQYCSPLEVILTRVQVN